MLVLLCCKAAIFLWLGAAPFFRPHVTATSVPILTRGRNMSSALATKNFQRANHMAILTRWGSKGIRETLLNKRQDEPLGQQNAGTGLNEYLAQVSFGTPQQTFSLLLDTGSSDVWVMDPSCSSCAPSTPAFNARASSTYQSSAVRIDLEYGTLSAGGYAAADTISMANYTVTSQTFILVDRVSQGSLSFPCSGILGLAWQSLTTTGATPWWQLLAVQGVLQKNVFTFQLSRNSISANSAELQPGGIFTLGELDSKQYTGSPTYVKLLSESYWTIPIDGITLQGTPISLSQGQNEAIIDTGTALIVTPVSVAQAIYRQIDGAQRVEGQEGIYAIPCNTNNINIALVFGGQTFAIDPADMLNGALNEAGTYCLGGIVGQSLGQGTPDYIIGSTFLKNVFTIFDFDGPSVGFAALVGNTAQTLSTMRSTNGAESVSATGGATTPVSPTQGPRLPPLLSSGQRQSTTLTGIQGASGLSAPVAISTGPSQNMPSSASHSQAKNALKSVLSFMLTITALVL